MDGAATGTQGRALSSRPLWPGHEHPGSCGITGAWQWHGVVIAQATSRCCLVSGLVGRVRCVNVGFHPVRRAGSGRVVACERLHPTPRGQPKPLVRVPIPLRRPGSGLWIFCSSVRMRSPLPRCRHVRCRLSRISASCTRQEQPPTAILNHNSHAAHVHIRTLHPLHTLHMDIRHHRHSPHKETHTPPQSIVHFSV